jgi:hypothetical protein
VFADESVVGYDVQVSKTQAEGIRLDEARTINKSLLALGQVIVALSTHKVSFHQARYHVAANGQAAGRPMSRIAIRN